MIMNIIFVYCLLSTLVLLINFLDTPSRNIDDIINKIALGFGVILGIVCITIQCVK